jgi:hypothetical protein
MYQGSKIVRKSDPIPLKLFDFKIKPAAVIRNRAAGYGV